MRCHKPLSFWMLTFMTLHLHFAIPFFHSALRFASSRPSQRLGRISVGGFLSSPLIVLSKCPKLTRYALVRHCLGSPEYGPCRLQIFLAQHFASAIPVGLNNAVKVQLITARRTGPLHGRLSVPYMCVRRGYLGLRSTTCTSTALPSDKAYPPRGSENARRARLAA